MAIPLVFLSTVASQQFNHFNVTANLVPTAVPRARYEGDLRKHTLGLTYIGSLLDNKLEASPLLSLILRGTPSGVPLVPDGDTVPFTPRIPSDQLPY